MELEPINSFGLVSTDTGNVLNGHLDLLYSPFPLKRQQLYAMKYLRYPITGVKYSMRLFQNRSFVYSIPYPWKSLNSALDNRLSSAAINIEVIEYLQHRNTIWGGEGGLVKIFANAIP